MMMELRAENDMQQMTMALPSENILQPAWYARLWFYCSLGVGALFGMIALCTIMAGAVYFALSPSSLRQGYSYFLAFLLGAPVPFLLIRALGGHERSASALVMCGAGAILLHLIVYFDTFSTLDAVGTVAGIAALVGFRLFRPAMMQAQASEKRPVLPAALIMALALVFWNFAKFLFFSFPGTKNELLPFCGPAFALALASTMLLPAYYFAARIFRAGLWVALILFLPFCVYLAYETYIGVSGLYILQGDPDLPRPDDWYAYSGWEWGLGYVLAALTILCLLLWLDRTRVRNS